MHSNLVVYQLSKSYHILREHWLIEKMLLQITEECLLSKYELSVFNLNEELENLFIKEIDSVYNMKLDMFKIIKNHIKEAQKYVFNEKLIFEKDKFLNPRLASYLSKGPYIDYGEGLFLYGIHDRTYEIKAKGFGVPLSNFDLVFYKLGELKNKFGNIDGKEGLYLRKDNLYFLDKNRKEEMIDSSANCMSYKSRKDVSFFCNAYEWLWTSKYLQELAKDSTNNFILEMPYKGAVNDNGIILNNENDIILDLGKIEFDVVTLSNALGRGTIKLKESIIKEKPLIIISHNNSSHSQKTSLEIDQSLKRPIIVFALNTEIKFKDKPQIQGAFFCDRDSKASGPVVLDGHFSFYRGSHYLDELNVQFERTEETKIKLAKIIPHVFMVDIFFKANK